MARALSLLASNSTNTPIILKLSGHVQTNDRLAIREMGRQIAIAEGTKPVEDDTDEAEVAENGEAEVSSPPRVS
jgi:origin recognition complex subunit 4